MTPDGVRQIIDHSHACKNRFPRKGRYRSESLTESQETPAANPSTLNSEDPFFRQAAVFPARWKFVGMT
jgi:hypothetical protein